VLADSALKQVWLLNHYAQEPGGAGGTRHYSIAKHLMKSGWNASIIAASVELQSGRQRLSGRRKWKLTKSGGISFLWVRTPQHSGNGLGRLWNMLVYSARVLLPSVTRELPRPDVIVGSSVHPFAAWSAARLARRFDVPFIFEVRDLWPQTLVDLGRLNDRSVITWLLRRLEKWLYWEASRIVVLLPNAADYIVPLGIPIDKIRWIPNGVDLEGSSEPDPAQHKDSFTFMYFGAHGTANGLDIVLRAMQKIELDPALSRIRLRLIGDGPGKSSLQELSRSLRLSRVGFEEPVPKAEIPDLASEADAFVFNLVDAPVFRYGISSNKLFDFLAAARPIVFCCKSANNPVAEAGAGITVQPGEPVELAQAMAKLAELPSTERVAMGLAGRKFVSQFHDFRTLAMQFSQVLDAAAATDHRSVS
jgi:glycosyltransferase involved in cell wall biosynthesis